MNQKGHIIDQKALKMYENKAKNAVLGPEKTCFLVEFSLAKFLHFQGVEHKVNENSGYFRRTVENINNSAFDKHQ